MVNCLVGKILELIVIIYLINCTCDAFGRAPDPAAPPASVVYASLL